MRPGVVFAQSLTRVWLFVTPWTIAHQFPLSSTISLSLLKFMSIESVMPSNHLILCFCPQFFPASGSFPVSQLFASGGQSSGASATASVLPVNIQDWFPLGWTGWISFQSKGLSRVFSNTTVEKHQFWASAFFMCEPSTLACIHDYWRNHSFEDRFVTMRKTIKEEVHIFLFIFNYTNVTINIPFLLLPVWQNKNLYTSLFLKVYTT